MIRELKHSSTQILTKIYFCREIFPFKQISLTYMCTAKTEPVLIGQLSVFEIFSSPLINEIVSYAENVQKCNEGSYCSSCK